MEGGLHYIYEIMRDLINEGKVAVFVDDVLVGTEGEKEHDKIVVEVLKRLENKIQEWNSK